MWRRAMIDITKQYKTRDGRDVRILCVDGPNETYPVIGIIGDEKSVCSWTCQGCSGLFTLIDLLEVKPKIVVERWVNILQYPGEAPIFDPLKSESSALKEAYGGLVTVLARAVPFKWEEGQ
jgi:hypothetical protein